MKKVYLLLRNNHQSGPYTIKELLQQKVHPFDLVWVEGSSRAWSYPTELPELKAFFEGKTADTHSAETSQHPDLPMDDPIEQWAEELRQRALSAPRIFIPPTLKGETAPVEALRTLAQERIEFIDHRKEKSPAFEWMSGAMVMLVVVTSVYAGTRIFNASASLPVVTHRAITIDSHAAKSVATPVPEPAFTAYAEVKKDTVVAIAPPIVRQKPVVIPKKKKINIEARPATAIERIPVPSHENGSASSSAPTVPDESKKEVLIEPEPRLIVTEEPVEKKKSGLFKGLFRKKKKNDESAPEQNVKEAQQQRS